MMSLSNQVHLVQNSEREDTFTFPFSPSAANRSDKSDILLPGDLTTVGTMLPAISDSEGPAEPVGYELPCPVSSNIQWVNSNIFRSSGSPINLPLTSLREWQVVIA